MTNNSQELLQVGFCNLVQMLSIICCFMWKRTRLLLPILPLIFSFFFLSNFQIWKKSSLFSQGMRGLQSWNLVHTWTVGWCIIYTWLRLLVLIYSFISSIFFLSNFKILIFFVHFSVRHTKLKLDTHRAKGWSSVHQIQAGRIYLFFFFFFLSFQLAKIKNLLLQNCFNILLMAVAGGMWALLTLCYIFT